jgi:hypothetical protein
MDFITDLFFPPYKAKDKAEVERIIEDLASIGRQDDFLAERPTPGFNGQLRHRRARELGERLNELGSINLMTYVSKKIKKRLGKEKGVHLDYAWADIGQWVP